MVKWSNAEDVGCRHNETTQKQMEVSMLYNVQTVQVPFMFKSQADTVMDTVV